MSKVQHYGKVMQENFDEILFFSWLSGEILLETMFRKISPHFHDTLCYGPIVSARRTPPLNFHNSLHPPPQSFPNPRIDHSKFDPGLLQKWLGLL